MGLFSLPFWLGRRVMWEETGSQTGRELPTCLTPDSLFPFYADCLDAPSLDGLSPHTCCSSVFPGYFPQEV